MSTEQKPDPQPDTLRPPPPDDAPAVMTCGQFKGLIKQLIGDKLLELHELLQQALQRLGRHEHRLDGHEYELGRLRADVEGLRAQIAELKGARP